MDDWNQWCATHHIKIKGSDSHDDRTDEGRTRQGISGAEMGQKSGTDGRQAGVRRLQGHGAQRPVMQKVRRKNKT